MHKVVESDRRDVSGKIVDEIDWTEDAFVYWFYSSGNEEGIRLAVFEVMRALAERRSKRIRERDFIVLQGFQRYEGKQIPVVCVPKKMLPSILNALREALNRFNCTDVGSFPVRKLVVKPVGRYMDGKIIIYTRPQDRPKTLPKELDVISSWNVPWETRSAKLNVVSVRKENPLRKVSRVGLPKIKEGSIHTDEIYEQVCGAMNDVLCDTDESSIDFLSTCGFGYKTLRNLCRRNFGISVVEQLLPDGVFGGLFPGLAITEDVMGCKVTIRIDERLAEPMKYLALAHELSHYIAHYQWLLVNAWGLCRCQQIPELVVLLRNYREKTSLLDSRILEKQADQITLEWLIGPVGLKKSIIDDMKYFRGGASLRYSIEILYRQLATYFPGESVQASAAQIEERIDEKWAIPFEEVGDFYRTIDNPQVSHFDRYLVALRDRLSSGLEGIETQQRIVDDAASELYRLFSANPKGGKVTRQSVSKLINSPKMRREGWVWPDTNEEYMSWFGDMLLEYFGLVGETKFGIYEAYGADDSSMCCPVSVLIPALKNPEDWDAYHEEFLQPAECERNKPVGVLPRIDYQLWLAPAGARPAPIDKWIQKMPDRSLLMVWPSPAMYRVLLPGIAV